jgi:hypothetical protein
MKQLSKSLILGFVLALIYLPPLHAQMDTNAPTDPSAANPAPAGQAPDEVTNKITDLVHAGKYAEAQQLTTGLLAAYPGDQRLIKAKALLEKLLAPAGSANAVPASNPPINNVAPAQLAASTNTEPLSGMEKVDYDALIELARQAQQTTDLSQQNTLLQQFMTDSDKFLHKHPAEMLLWQLRAASAISLGNPVAGCEAGEKLLALGAADSADSNLRRLLAQLKNKGWLDRQEAQKQAESAEAERLRERLKAEHDKYTFPAAHAHWKSYSYGHMTINENDLVYVASDETISFSKNDIREMKVVCLAKDMCGFYFIPKDGRKFFFLAVTEFAVANSTIQGKVVLPPSVLGNAAVERWKFVSTDGNKALKPPIP